MRLGVIGGSGLYELEDLQEVRQIKLDTPFGAPSDVYTRGVLGGSEVFFLPRHGRGHRLLPSEINHRANIWGFKKLGVEYVVSVSAVGSLREELRPRHVVLPDQYFDRTKHASDHTFFGRGVVAHVSFGDPACGVLREASAAAAEAVVSEMRLGEVVRVHRGGTYVNMEGPAFSTRAESETYRRLGFDVIGMTSLPEAKLCREAEICYQAMAMVTDYDCWHATEAEVTVELIVGILRANVELARHVIRGLVGRLPATRTCPCRDALRNAILTDLKTAPAETLHALEPILGRYRPANVADA